MFHQKPKHSFTATLLIKILQPHFEDMLKEIEPYFNEAVLERKI